MILKRLSDDLYGGRKWEWRPTIDFYKGTLSIGIGMFLTFFNGETDDRMIDYYLFEIFFNPKQWKGFSNLSYWYDGPHNLFVIGPFGIAWRHPATKRACL